MKNIMYAVSGKAHDRKINSHRKTAFLRLALTALLIVIVLTMAGCERTHVKTQDLISQMNDFIAEILADGTIVQPKLEPG